MILWAFLIVVAAYLIGSVNFAVIFSNLFMKKDVRSMGSGNAGATNVMRNAGFLPGALTFLCDAVKGLVASLAGKMVFDYIYNSVGESWAMPIYGAYLCGVACMLGHVFSIYFQFKGGKGVATSVGIYAICCAPAIGLGVLVFALLTIITRYVSLASITGAVVVVSSSLFFATDGADIWPQAVLSIIMGVIVISKHSTNIYRLINGTESKVGGKKKNG